MIRSRDFSSDVNRCRILEAFEVAGPCSTTLERHERPNGFGVCRVKFKKAEPNARDGQVLADLFEWQRLDLRETCRTTESACDHIAWLGLVSGDFADDGHRSQRLTVGVRGRRGVDADAVAGDIRARGDRLPWLAMTKPPCTPRLAWSREATITQCRRVVISET